MNLAPHPYADAWPMLGSDDLAELAEDIALNGLRDAIVIYDGKILDGRNRYAACAAAGATPVYEDFNGDDDDALAFVQSVNNARRHQSRARSPLRGRCPCSRRGRGAVVAGHMGRIVRTLTISTARWRRDSASSLTTLPTSSSPSATTR